MALSLTKTVTSNSTTFALRSRKQVILLFYLCLFKPLLTGSHKITAFAYGIESVIQKHHILKLFYYFISYLTIVHIYFLAMSKSIVLILRKKFIEGSAQIEPNVAL